MASTRCGVLLVSIAALSGCRGSIGPALFVEIERSRDDFTRKALPQFEPPLLSLELVEPVEVLISEYESDG